MFVETSGRLMKTVPNVCARKRPGLFLYNGQAFVIAFKKRRNLFISSV